MNKYRAWSEPGHKPLHPGGKSVFGYGTLMWLKRRAKKRGHRVSWKVVTGPRDKMKAWMDWALVHTVSIHYQQSRPIPLQRMKQHKLPIYSDCSGTTTGCHYAAGVPDPNGRHYDGSGYTGTLRSHCPEIKLGHAKAGDFIVYGPGPGSHCVVVRQPGSDPTVFSHGQESGPKLYKHSAQNRYHGGYFTVHKALV